jgi:hypothetical protein
MKSSYDLYEDGFPHSTVAGHERGCRGSACPGKLEYGFSCSEAVTRTAGDWAFGKLVAAGKTPAEISAELGLLGGGKPTPAEVQKPKRVAAPKPSAPAALPTPEPEPGPEPEPEPATEVRPAPVDGVRKESRTVGGLVHGSMGGYARGCRTDADCPNTPLSGYWTCRQANSAYQAEYRRRRIAREAAAVEKDRFGTPLAEQDVAETAPDVVLEPAEASVPDGSVSLSTAALTVTLVPMTAGGIEIRISIPGAAS